MDFPSPGAARTAIDPGSFLLKLCESQKNRGDGMAQDDAGSVEYARRLYDDVLGWYRSAESKAQIVLGIDGAFLAFLTGAIFTKPDELNAKIQAFSPWTCTLLGLMTVCLLTSVAA